MTQISFQLGPAVHLTQTLAWVSAGIAVLWILLIACEAALGRLAANRRYVVLVICQFAMGLSLPLTFLILNTPAVIVPDTPWMRFSRASVKLQDFSSLQSAKGQMPRNDTPGEAAAIVDHPTVSISKAVTSSSPHLSSINWMKLAPYLCWMYCAIVVLMLFRLLTACYRGQRLMEISEAIQQVSVLQAISGQAHRIGLHYVPSFASCDVVVPCVIGFLRPMLLLPLAALSTLSPEQIEMVIAHELAHIRRFDPIVNILQRIVEVFLFFHPAVWHLSSKIQYARECCCDDLVLHNGPDPIEYAEVLALLAKHVIAQFSLPIIDSARPLLAATGRPSQLRMRIARLLNVKPIPLRDEPIRLSRNSTAAVTFIAVLLCAGLFKNLVSVSSASIAPVQKTVVAKPRILVNDHSKKATALFNGMAPLHIAVATGTVDQVAGLIKSGSALDQLTSQGWSPLEFAAYLGRQDMINLLIHAGADPNLIDRQGRTPLFAALGLGPSALLGSTEKPQLDVVVDLVSQGAATEFRAHGGLTPLDGAAVRGMADICSYLLDHGADINSHDDLGSSPVVYACESRSPETLQTLIDRGADLTVRKKDGYDLFDVLGLQPRATGPIPANISQCAVLLKQHGLKPKLGPAVALGLAQDVKDQLAKRSPNLLPGDENYRRYSPLMWAVKRQNVELCRMLVSAGADVNTTDVAGNSILYEAAGDTTGDVTIEQLLITAGADVNKKDRAGETAMFHAFRRGDFALAQLLVLNGAETELKNGKGITPLQVLSKDLSRSDAEKFQTLVARAASK